MPLADSGAGGWGMKKPEKVQVTFTKAQLDALLWLIRLIPVRCKPADKEHPLFKAQWKIKAAVHQLNSGEAAADDVEQEANHA